jgi:hypothetical protein
MMYTLIDPPVSPYSPPEKITAWVDELRGWRKLPEFQDLENRQRLEDALAEAESWLTPAAQRPGVAIRRTVQPCSPRRDKTGGTMYYVLIDPPVSAFSPPDEIRAWITELRSRSSREEFQYPEGRRTLEEALAEAEEWLAESLKFAGRTGERPPESPAAS